MDHPVIIFPNSLVRECDEVRGPAGSVADDDGHRRRVRHVLEHGADSVGAALDHQAADPSEHIVQQQCVIIRLISNNFERVGILKMDLMITVSPSPPKIYCWSGYGCYQLALEESWSWTISPLFVMILRCGTCIKSRTTGAANSKLFLFYFL